MPPSSTDAVDPLSIYRRMQEAVLRDEDPTLLPAELLADDLVVETPFSPPGMRRYEGREAWLDFYQASSATLPVRFDGLRELATHRTDDPEVIVVEYELTATVTTTGERGSVTCIAVLRVRDGLITHWREYQNLPAIEAAVNRARSDAATKWSWA